MVVCLRCKTGAHNSRVHQLRRKTGLLCRKTCDKETESRRSRHLLLSIDNPALQAVYADKSAAAMSPENHRYLLNQAYPAP
ncbi:hypothetical protein LSTR_LSTR000112 [Laodelphax striatellus]|uniref:Uncharacterized protein n=1 Tax=Laodelphax striatellus TaxID=195883 RepID=A0A482X7F4_LAOST|nr:hypothetical protein LSTR_LSTR000112 [Laodelphax striatellus]